MILSDKISQPDLAAVGAQSLKDKAAGVYLAMSVDKTLRKATPDGSFQRYVENVLAECGNPADAIERMLVEQLTLAHHTIGRLYAQANYATSPQEAEVHLGCAARLIAEMRRTALALKQYRQGPSQQVTVIGQQNVAQEQQIAYVPPAKKALPSSKRRKQPPKSRLSGPSQESIAYEREHSFEARGETPAEAKAVVRRGPRATAADHPPRQALVALDGAEDA